MQVSPVGREGILFRAPRVFFSRRLTRRPCLLSSLFR